MDTLVKKWTNVSIEALSHFRDLIGPVQTSFDADAKILTLHELATSLKFEINRLGAYSQEDDEFKPQL